LGWQGGGTSMWETGVAEFRRKMSQLRMAPLRGQATAWPASVSPMI
jgi:hypothetical protein